MPVLMLNPQPNGPSTRGGKAKVGKAKTGKARAGKARASKTKIGRLYAKGRRRATDRYLGAHPDKIGKSRNVYQFAQKMAAQGATEMPNPSPGGRVVLGKWVGRTGQLLGDPTQRGAALKRGKKFRAAWERGRVKFSKKQMEKFGYPYLPKEDQELVQDGSKWKKASKRKRANVHARAKYYVLMEESGKTPKARKAKKSGKVSGSSSSSASISKRLSSVEKTVDGIVSKQELAAILETPVGSPAPEAAQTIAPKYSEKANGMTEKVIRKIAGNRKARQNERACKNLIEAARAEGLWTDANNAEIQEMMRLDGPKVKDATYLRVKKIVEEAGNAVKAPWVSYLPNPPITPKGAFVAAFAGAAVTLLNNSRPMVDWTKKVADFVNYKTVAAVKPDAHFAHHLVAASVPAVRTGLLFAVVHALDKIGIGADLGNVKLGVGIAALVDVARGALCMYDAKSPTGGWRKYDYSAAFVAAHANAATMGDYLTLPANRGNGMGDYLTLPANRRNGMGDYLTLPANRRSGMGDYLTLPRGRSLGSYYGGYQKEFDRELLAQSRATRNAPWMPKNYYR